MPDPALAPATGVSGAYVARTGPSSVPGDLVRLTSRERRSIVAALETSMLNLGGDGCATVRALQLIVKKLRP